MSATSISSSPVVFNLPDEITSLPELGFEFDASCREQAARALAEPATRLYARLVRDQESPTVFLIARRVIDGFLRRGAQLSGTSSETAPTADAIAVEVLAARDELAAALETLRGLPDDVREAVLRERAPVGLVAGCWLDLVSQASTQPSVVVNRLFSHYFALQGEGNPQRGVHHVRSRWLETEGAYLPEIDADDFMGKAGARELTAWHGCFYLALSKLPASFLPEVAGVHYAFHALGVDDLMAGKAPVLAEPTLREALAEYLELAARNATADADPARLLAAVRLTVQLEREQVGLLTDLAGWLGEATLDEKAARIIERHAPYAGSQHGDVRVRGRRLTDIFADPEFDLAGFVAEFRASRQLKPMPDGDSRFTRALKFGGPMFGVFDEREAAVFAAWAEQVQAGQAAEVVIRRNTLGDASAAAWREAVLEREPADVRYAEARARDDRELLYRLVNLENFPSALTLARARAEDGLEKAGILFEHGAGGRYTDATYFDYTEQALYERVERIYWDKLVGPYQKLEQIPDADEVIFGQKIFALGSLIDGSWAHRIGNLGRYRRPADGMLFSIYADEMGRGDLRKNHITLIHQVLTSMSVHLPHIRDAAFVDQAELPDMVYHLPLHQLCLSLFPDSLYEEILGYNLGIEMFGLGEMRLHEMQKLRHHGFDPIYEEAHLSIDNVSAGHARQSADIVARHLDGVRRASGEGRVQESWRRIWRGYASFAYFIETPLIKDLDQRGAAAEPAALLI